jgi:hypothetical protein
MTITLENQPISKPATTESNLIALRRMPLWLYGFAAFAFVLVCMLQFHAWVSVEQGDSRDHSDASATSFYVADNGYLSLRRVLVECSYLKQDGTYLTHTSKLLDDLTFKNRQRIPCAVNTDHDLDHRGGIRFKAKVDYRAGWLPLHRSQTFEFKSVAVSNGAYLWLPQ